MKHLILLLLIVLSSCSTPQYIVLPAEGDYYEFNTPQNKDFFVFDYTIYPCKIYQNRTWDEGIVLEGRDTIAYAIVNGHISEYVENCNLRVYKNGK